MLGCSAQMMNSPTASSGASRFAPVRRSTPEISVIKYSADGAPFLVQQRKDDAYRQMYTSCGGSYEILREELVKDGAQATAFDTPVLGLAVTSVVAQPLSSWMIQFKCVEEDAAQADFTYPINGPKLIDGRPCPTNTKVADVEADSAKLKAVACVADDGRTLQGPYLSYWRSSNYPERSGNYRDGLPDGDWVHAAEDGTPLKKVRWSKGQRLSETKLGAPSTYAECRAAGGQWTPLAQTCDRN